MNKELTNSLTHYLSFTLLFGYAISSYGNTESSTSFVQESVESSITTNQVQQDEDFVGNKFVVIADERSSIYSLSMEDLLKIYKKKNVKYAYDYFINKGFKKGTDKDNAVVTITYDGKSIKIVVIRNEEVNPYPWEWSTELTNDGYSVNTTDMGNYTRVDWQKIGSPLVSEAADFRESGKFRFYLFIGEFAKI